VWGMRLDEGKRNTENERDDGKIAVGTYSPLEKGDGGIGFRVWGAGCQDWGVGLSGLGCGEKRKTENEGDNLQRRNPTPPWRRGMGG
jgi:hypothetical protein